MTNRINVIAEFCQNHNGDYEILREMVHQAAEAGATHAKVQTIFADELAFREPFEEGLVRDGKTIAIKRPYRAEYDRLKRLELDYDQQARFIEDCRAAGMEPLTTCFTRGQVEPLSRLGWREVKVASYDCGSLPLLRDLAARFDHLIISTGATHDHEIESASQLLRSLGASFTFLHCVTIYPTPLTEMHLKRLEYLKQLSPSIGLSNHAHVRDGVKPDLVAIWLGATYVERHFTVLAPDQTRDGPVSITADHVREIVRFGKMTREDQSEYLRLHVQECDVMMGSEHRDLSDQELLNRDYYRGRFATKRGDRVIYNWEDQSV